MKFISAGLLCLLVAFATSVNGAALDEDFGYVDVRPGAHMFWVTYHTELPGNWTEHPLIMWLQGGPGASGVGYGNFEELGPYDINGNLRDGRWTKKANVMFVDNPVGSGYSYVDDLALLSQDNAQIANDLVALLTSVFTDYPEMQVMPFFVYAESYGGKMTADFALALDQAILNGDIICNFQGIALGDSWISPMDSVNTWGSFLYSMGFVNAQGQARIDASAQNTQDAVDQGNWVGATNQWTLTEIIVSRETNGVNFYNVLAEENIYDSPLSSKKKFTFMTPAIQRLYDLHIRPQPLDALTDFMNGPQAAAWNIPPTVSWGSQSGDVFDTLSGDFMKPVITSVESLLTNSKIHVSVYTGDLDLICDTPGTYRWIENMNYPQKTNFDATDRAPLHVTAYSAVAAYVQRYDRFSVFTILRSGHMVPIDAPEMCLNMIDMITQYGAETVVPKKHKVEVLHHLKAKHAEAKKEEIKVETKVEEVKTKVEEASKHETKEHKKSPPVKHDEKDHKKAVEVKEQIKELVMDVLKEHPKIAPKVAAKAKPSPHEKELKAKVAHSHIKTIPGGRQVDTGNVFHRKHPEIGIKGVNRK